MSLKEPEQIEILEGIARDGSNKAAQISAIKLLREIEGRKEPEKVDPGVMDAPARRTSHLKVA